MSSLSRLGNPLVGDRGHITSKPKDWPDLFVKGRTKGPPTRHPVGPTSCWGAAFLTRIEGKSITETSTKSRMTAANATQALMQDPQTATEIARSRLLEIVVNERVVVLK